MEKPLNLFNQSHTVYITLYHAMVFNALGGWHTHICTYEHTQMHEPKQLQETNHVPATGQHETGLKTKKSSRIKPLRSKLSSKVLYNRVTIMVLSCIFKPFIYSFTFLPPTIHPMTKYISNTYLLIAVCITKSFWNIWLQKPIFSLVIGLFVKK